MIVRSFSVMLSLVLLGLTAAAQSGASEASIARSFTSSSLQWGACPDFIPKGCEITVLHGDPSKANADIFFKVPPNFTIPWHTHTSAERMVLVSGTLRVTYEGEKATTLKPGMYAYGPAGKAHMAVCEKGDPCVLFIAFESPVDALPAKLRQRSPMSRF